MKRLLLLLLLAACLVLSACNYPVAHRTVASTVPGAGQIEIDYVVADELKSAFNSAASYRLNTEGAELYVYEIGAPSDRTLGENCVAVLQAKDALSFTYTGVSQYRLTVRYSGLEKGSYELRWNENLMEMPEKCVYFYALDKDGTALSYVTQYGPSETRMVSCSHYLIDGVSTPIVFTVGEPAIVVPATGDSATPLLWGGLLAAAAAGMALLMRKKVRD